MFSWRTWSIILMSKQLGRKVASICNEHNVRHIISWQLFENASHQWVGRLRADAFFAFPTFHFPADCENSPERLLMKVVFVFLESYIVFRVFVFRSNCSPDGLGKDSNKEKQVQDHLQIFKKRVNWSSRQCHWIAFRIHKLKYCFLVVSRWLKLLKRRGN